MIEEKVKKMFEAASHSKPLHACKYLRQAKNFGTINRKKYKKVEEQNMFRNLNP